MSRIPFPVIPGLTRDPENRPIRYSLCTDAESFSAS